MRKYLYFYNFRKIPTDSRMGLFLSCIFPLAMRHFAVKLPNMKLYISFLHTASLNFAIINYFA